MVYRHASDLAAQICTLIFYTFVHCDFASQYKV